jgi:hypothetical protein
MAFQLVWVKEAKDRYDSLSNEAHASLDARQSRRREKATKAEGLFKQIRGCIQKLLENPRHPGLNSHKFDGMEHPYEKDQPVFEAYAQNRTPGAYRVFWCYGPARDQITIIAITPHP